MVAWLYEQTGHRVDRAIVVSPDNPATCGAGSVPIAWYRL